MYHQSAHSRRSPGGPVQRPRQVEPARLRVLNATLMLLKVAELRILLGHLHMSRTGSKAHLAYRITEACANDPRLYRPVVAYIKQRDLIPPGSTASSARRAPMVRRAADLYMGQGQVGARAHSYTHHPTQHQIASVGSAPPVAPKASQPTPRAYSVAAEYLDALAIRDPFVEKMGTVLRVAIFRMPELYQRFDMSGSLLSLIRSGFTCRLTCLELTNAMNKNSTSHRWPTNAKLWVNGSPVTLQQRQTEDGKVKFKSVMERPANIQALVRLGENTFRLSGQPNQEHGDWPFGICITVVRQRKLSELMDRLREKSTLTLEETLEKIKKFYSQDADVVTEKLSVSLKDPLTLTKIKIPARGRNCTHLGCFDLEYFLNFQRDAKHAQWKCVLCDAGPLTLKDIVIDKWMEEIVEHCKDLENVFKVDVFEDGKYTPVFSEQENDEDNNDDEDEGKGATGQKRKFDGIKEEEPNEPPVLRQSSQQSLGANYDDAIELD